MRFTVVWTPLALARLADLWLAAPNRNAITVVQHRIDQLLRIDADAHGIPFFGNWLLFVSPLRVRFAIDWGDMKVEVFDVW